MMVSASFSESCWNGSPVSVGNIIYDCVTSTYKEVSSSQQGGQSVSIKLGLGYKTGDFYTMSSDRSRIGYQHIVADNDSWAYVSSTTFNLTSTPTCPTGQDLNASGICSCPTGQDLVAGICVPKCPDGQTVGADGKCVGTCPTGAKYDTTLKTCVSNYDVLSKNTFDNGNFIVSWADGASTYCDVSESKCITHDKNWNVIPNRYLNPEFNPDGTVKYAGILPDSLPTSSWAGAAYDALGKPLVDVAGRFLQAFGMGLALSATGGGYVVSDSPGLNALNPFAVVGAGIFTLGSAMVTPDDVTTAVPNGSDAVQVKVSNNTGTSFTPLDTVASSAPADGTPVFTPDGVYTYRQITDANLKTIWDTASGVGTLPPTALVRGSDIIYPTNNPNTALINSPTQIEIVKTSPDNSAQSVVVNKADLANTANSGTDLPYTVKDYAPPVINNDGTKTQPVTSTPSSMSPSTGIGTSTNPTTGQTTTANPATGTNNAGMSNGTNIDLSGVTGRLDGLANQLTALNGKADTGNGLLGDIKANTGAIASNTASMKGSLANMSNLMSQTSDGLTEQTWNNSIPSDYSVFDTWKTAWTNMKGDIDSVSSKGTELKELVSGDLELNLIDPAMMQCPYNANLDLVFSQIPISFDFCSVLSPFRPVIYNMFYLFFVFNIIYVSLKTLVRLV